jgi:hypothetical protein
MGKIKPEKTKTVSDKVCIFAAANPSRTIAEMKTMR